MQIKVLFLIFSILSGLFGTSNVQSELFVKKVSEGILCYSKEFHFSLIVPHEMKLLRNVPSALFGMQDIEKKYVIVVVAHHTPPSASLSEIAKKGESEFKLWHKVESLEGDIEGHPARSSIYLGGGEEPAAACLTYLKKGNVAVGIAYVAKLKDFENGQNLLYQILHSIKFY